MPNWCDNVVKITGPKQVIDEIEAIVDEKNNDKEREHGLLNYFRPMPIEEKENWYQWSVDNWGTKWDVTSFYGVKREDDNISFSFSSAWGPPTEAYTHFLNNNELVTIDAKYYEPGMDFAGIYDNGEDDSFTLSEAAPDGSKDEFWKSYSGKILDDEFNIVEQMADYEDNVEGYENK